MMKHLKRISGVIVGLLIISSIVFIFLVNRKVISAKEALQHLVYSETKGNYTLLIKDYSFTWDPVTITFDSLQVFRHDSVPGDVHKVIVPHMVFTAGSVLDFMRGNQLDVQSLSIEEPVIELASREAKSSGLQFSQQVVKLYPAVLKVMERFNIVHVGIKRASIGIKKRKNDLQLNFIDLLLENWNVRDLNPDRQLRLAMGRQVLGLSKGTFDFAALEYDFQKRQLLFSDFKYVSDDTLKHSTFSAGGEYIAFQKLDYNELFHNQRLVYEKIHFHNPTIRGRFIINRERKSSASTQKIVSDLVRRSVGEFLLDSAIFQHAAIHLTLITNKDSIVVDLHDVTIKTDRIKIIPDREYQVGNVAMHMSKTKLGIKNNLALSFDKILFGSDNRLVIEQVELTHQLNGKKIAVIPFIELNKIDLLQSLISKRLESASIVIRNARINIDSDLFPKSSNGAGVKFPIINLGELVLQNALIDINDGSKSISVSGINSRLYKVNTDSSHRLNFRMSKMSGGRVLVKIPEKGININAEDFQLQDYTVDVRKIELEKDQLKFDILNLTAAHQDLIEDPRVIDYKLWSTLAIGQLTITGQQKIPHSKGNPIEFETMPNKIRIDHLNLDVKSGDTTLVADVKKFSAQKVSGDANGVGYDFTGLSEKIRLNTDLVSVQIDSLDFQWPKSIKANYIDFTDSKKSLGVRNFEVLTIKKDDRGWEASTMLMKSVTFKSDMGFQFAADSIQSNDFKLANGSPKISFLEIFNPFIHVDQKQETHESKNKKPLDIHMLGRFIFHPGRVEFADRKVVSFGKVEGDIQESKISVEYVDHTLLKNNLRMDKFSLSENDLHIDSITIAPNEHWYANNEIEDSKLRMVLSNLSITNQSFDSIIFNKSLRPGSLEIGNMNVVTARDKRMLDPPEIEKPWSLGAMLKLPSAFPIQSINLKDGDITIQETSDKTGLTGMITINDINASVEFNRIPNSSAVTVNAQAKLYNEGVISLKYTTPHPDTFKLAVRLNNFDLTRLNQFVLPSQSVEIESGYLNRYLAEIVATNESAVGAAGISYKKLHISLHRKDDLMKKGVGDGLLTFIADGFVLKHSRKWVRTEFNLDRLKHKSVFNYWARSSSRGAIEVVLNGR